MSKISQLKSQARRLWEGLSARDRLMLVIGCVVVVVYVGYVMYASLSQAVLTRTEALTEKQATLTWMRHAEQAHHAVQRQGPATLEGAQGLTVFSEALSHTPFQSFSYQLQQLKEGELQLSFESVPYNAFLTWLALMHTRYAFVIRSFDVERSEVPGLVKLSMVVALNGD